MKLKANTWLLITLAFLSVALIYVYEVYYQKPIVSEQTASRQLFNLSEKEIIKINIDQANNHLEFIKNTERPNPWQAIKPESFTANEATITFLLNLFANSQPKREFTISANHLGDYGLARSFARIEIELQDGRKQAIILGNTSDLNRDLIYATIKPQLAPEELEIFLVSKNWQYAIDRPLSEWKL
jgi:hypothetical protein